MNIHSLDSVKTQEVRVDYAPNECINYLPLTRRSPLHQKKFKYLTIPKEQGDTCSNAKILGFNGSGTQRQRKIRHNIHNSYLTLHLKSLELFAQRKQHNSTVNLG
jgi:hypothetical protein